MKTGLGINDKIARILRVLKRREGLEASHSKTTSFSLLHIILWISDKLTLSYPQPPPNTNDFSHTPLQSVKDGGLHYIIPGRKFVEAFLLDLCVIFSLSVIILLLVIKRAM